MGVLTLGTIILVVILIQVDRFLAVRSNARTTPATPSSARGTRSWPTGSRRGSESAAETLADLRARTSEIERILREVD